MLDDAEWVPAPRPRGRPACAGCPSRSSASSGRSGACCPWATPGQRPGRVITVIRGTTSPRTTGRRLGEAEAVIHSAVDSARATVGAFLDVKRLLTPDRYRGWLDREFAGRWPDILDDLALFSWGPEDRAKIMEVYPAPMVGAARRVARPGSRLLRMGSGGSRVAARVFPSTHPGHWFVSVYDTDGAEVAGLKRPIPGGHGPGGGARGRVRRAEDAAWATSCCGGRPRPTPTSRPNPRPREDPPAMTATTVTPAHYGRPQRVAAAHPLRVVRAPRRAGRALGHPDREEPAWVHPIQRGGLLAGPPPARVAASSSGRTSRAALARWRPGGAAQSRTTVRHTSC